MKPSTAETRQEKKFEWRPAALFIGIVVVAFLLATRFDHPTRVAPSPEAAVADYGTPPAGVPLIYLHDPNNTSWLIAYDWSGKPRGTVKFKQPTAVTMAPDGSQFGYAPIGKGGYSEFFDRLGNPIANQGSGGGNVRETWADDSRRVCWLDYAKPSGWNLNTKLAGEGSRSAPVAIDPDGKIVQSGIIAFGLEACSFRNDQAIIDRVPGPSISDLWIVRISDGKILRHELYSVSDPPFASVVVSRDASLLARNSVTSRGQKASTSTSTVVGRVSDGAVVAALTPEQGILAFSGDDSLVLVNTTPWVDGAVTHLAVIDFRSRQVRWVYEGPGRLGSFLAEPEGPGFAIALKVLGEPEVREILIISGSGSEVRIPGRYTPTW